MTLQGLVSQAYPSPEWAVFFEVANGTGFGASRRADAVALGIWPSRGQMLIGFEFKAHRGDWLRERKNPAKAETICAHCDAWYVVAAHDDVVKLDELPEPWGLYVANEDRTKLTTKKTCVPFEDRDRTTMRRSFVAAMLRKVTESTVPKAELARLIDEGVKSAMSNTHDGRELERLRKQVEDHYKAVDTFKAITGVNFHDWRGPEKIAKAVHAVLDGESYRTRLEHTANELTNAAKQIDRVLKEWPAGS